MNDARRFLFISTIAVLAVFAYRYDQYILNRNFTVHANIPCDPQSNQCFVADCTMESDPECDLSTYSKVTVRAADAPRCLEEHTCTDFSCAGIASCTVTDCSEDALGEGEVCALKPGVEPESPAMSGETASTTPE